MCPDSRGGCSRFGTGSYRFNKFFEYELLKPVKEIAKGLWQFKGNETVAEHNGISITAGVRWLADAADCTWLLDAIAELQPEFDHSEFQMWDLAREFDDDGLARDLKLTCTPVVSGSEDDEESDSSDDEDELDDDDIRQVIRSFDHPEFPLLDLTFYVTVEDGIRTLSLDTETTQAEERTTFLLVWNPDAYLFGEGEIDDIVSTIEEYGAAYSDWSTGNTKKIQPGDRLFLLRTGVEPRGIVASGYSYADIAEEEHWNPEKQAEGQTTRFAEVQWDEFLDPDSEPILLKADLVNNSAIGFPALVQSCISLPESVANGVEIE